MRAADKLAKEEVEGIDERVTVDGRMKGYRDAVARIATRHKLATSKLEPVVDVPDVSPDTPEVEEGLLTTPFVKAAQAVKAGAKHSPTAAVKAGVSAFRRGVGDELIVKGQKWHGKDTEARKKSAMKKAGLNPQPHPRTGNLSDAPAKNESAQSGSKQSPVDASTASSSLKYKSGSRHAIGITKRPEKKRASKAARRASKNVDEATIGNKNAPVTPGDMDYLSDFHKDVYGSRPKGTYKHVKTVGDYRKEIESLTKAASKEQARVKQTRTAQKKEKVIQKKRSFGPKNYSKPTNVGAAYKRALDKRKRG
jgi:hypothetical protein